MAVLIDSANVAFVANINLSNSLNVTIGSGDNFLIVQAASDTNTRAAPTVATYGGVNLTLIGGTNNGANDLIYWYYMSSPPVGTASLVLTFNTDTNGNLVTAIPLSGVNLGSVPVLGTAGNANPGTAVTCVNGSATGVLDLHFGGTINRGTSQTSGGAPQVAVIANQNGINSTICAACASIPGGNAGNFSWTITSGQWTALGITVFGGTAATAGPVPRQIYIMP